MNASHILFTVTVACVAFLVGLSIRLKVQRVKMTIMVKDHEDGVTSASEYNSGIVMFGHGRHEAIAKLVEELPDVTIIEKC